MSTAMADDGDFYRHRPAPDPNAPDSMRAAIYNPDGSLNPEKLAILEAASKTMSPTQKRATLQWLRAAVSREEIRTRYRNVAELAHDVDPDFVITPALQMISEAVEISLTRPKHNLLVTMPPQEGKSTLCAVWTPLRALQLNPNRRIILASYGDSLAEAHSATCRDWILRHGTGVTDPVTGAKVPDKLGLELRGRRLSSWSIQGGKGGLVAVGLGSAITGRPADLFIIDDPYKNMMEADSEAHRRRVDEWLDSVARTRLSPQASMILIQTRWHPDDLSGKVLRDEESLEPQYRTWKHINIPAISEKGIDDALGREPGVAMVSARGRTKEEFEQTKRTVGERVFYALYQGVPFNPAGGLFMREWFDPRVPGAPQNPRAAIVAIDPADTGEGDESGIIGGVLSSAGDQIILTEDWSGLHTAAGWSRKAVELALAIGAREIAFEAFASPQTYFDAIKLAWHNLRKEVMEKVAADEPITPLEARALVPDMPFTIFKWTAPKDAVARAALTRQSFEVKRARIVDVKMDAFVTQAVMWQPEQHCPDRVSAAVICHDRLYALGNFDGGIGSPLNTGPRPEPPRWMTRQIPGL